VNPDIQYLPRDALQSPLTAPFSLSYAFRLRLQSPLSPIQIHSDTGTGKLLLPSTRLPYHCPTLSLHTDTHASLRYMVVPPHSLYRLLIPFGPPRFSVTRATS